LEEVSRDLFHSPQSESSQPGFLKRANFSRPLPASACSLRSEISLTVDLGKIIEEKLDQSLTRRKQTPAELI
jgi:hypothetical protein